MTNEEIFKAEKVIADMRNDLAVIAATTDVDELIAVVLEKMASIVGPFAQLSVHRRLTIFGPLDVSLLYNALAVVHALAEIAERRPDFKVKLIDTVATKVPLADAILVRTAQALKDRPPFLGDSMEITKEQILNSEKLIAGIRDDLSVIVGTTDVEKLIALILEKVPRMIRSLYEVIRYIPTTIVSGPERDGFHLPLNTLLAYARIKELAPEWCSPDWKEKLLPYVAMYVPDIEANLDEIAHALKKMTRSLSQRPTLNVQLGRSEL